MARLALKFGIGGGIPFTLYGNFSALIGGNFKVLWNDTQIVELGLLCDGHGVVPQRLW